MKTSNIFGSTKTSNTTEEKLPATYEGNTTESEKENVSRNELLEEILMAIEVRTPKKITNANGAGFDYYASFGKIKDSREVVYDHTANQIYLAIEWHDLGYPVYDKELTLKGKGFSFFNKNKELTAEQQIVGQARVKYKEAD